MPITIEEVDAHFKELGYKVMLPDDPERKKVNRQLIFNTKRYCNAEGENSVVISIYLEPSGEYIELVAPRAYNVRECKNKGPVFAALLEIAYKTRNQNFEYDPSDGEIRVASDLPIEDGSVTQLQLDALLGAIIFTLDKFHLVIQHVIETGRIDLSLANEPDSDKSVGDPETAELVAKLGGIEGLPKLVASIGGEPS